MNLFLSSQNQASRNSIENEGFTLLELIVVIAGLGILAGLAIPNFLKYLEFAQVDEAKSLLNTAAAECSQEYRKAGSNSTSWKSIVPESIASRKSADGTTYRLPGPYRFKDGKNTCEEIQIFDPAEGATIFPTLRFRIDDDGKITKDSEYFNDEAKQAAESWGNAGGSESADYLIDCKADKKSCEINLDTALAAAKDGPLNIRGWSGSCTWPKSDCGCNRPVWSCSNVAYYTQESFDNCIKGKADLACTQNREKLKSMGHTGSDSQAGIQYTGICPNTEYYFEGDWLGEDKSTYDLRVVQKQNELAKLNAEKYLAEKQAWIDAGVSGKFNTTLSGFSPLWGCKNPTIFEVFDSEQKYQSECIKAPVIKPKCICPWGTLLTFDGSRCGPVGFKLWSNGPEGINCNTPGIRP